jgi:hypothetical protein
MPEIRTDVGADGVIRYDPTAPLRSRLELTQRLGWMNARRTVLLKYRDECARIADHHGVQDVSSDLRELDAAEAALRWVLGERETLGY